MYHLAIVDDEEEILRMLKKFLEREGKYHVSTYSEPKLALDSAKVKNYDLILLDVMMPELNGLDFLKEIKEYNTETEVIIMTAHSTLNTTLKSETYGAAAYIEKPFNSLWHVENQISEVLNT